jgi:hypothetical protein
MRTVLSVLAFLFVCIAENSAAGVRPANQKVDLKIKTQRQSIEGQLRSTLRRQFHVAKVNGRIENLVSQCPALRSTTVYKGDTIEITFDKSGNIAQAGITYSNKRRGLDGLLEFEVVGRQINAEEVAANTATPESFTPEAALPSPPALITPEPQPITPPPSTPAPARQEEFKSETPHQSPPHVPVARSYAWLWWTMGGGIVAILAFIAWHDLRIKKVPKVITPLTKKADETKQVEPPPLPPPAEPLKVFEDGVKGIRRTILDSYLREGGAKIGELTEPELRYLIVEGQKRDAATKEKGVFGVHPNARHTIANEITLKPQLEADLRQDKTLAAFLDQMRLQPVAPARTPKPAKGRQNNRAARRAHLQPKPRNGTTTPTTLVGTGPHRG